jgi:hypothetical protein
VNKLYRNPGAWLSLVLISFLTYQFFRLFPVVAAVLYGWLIAWIAWRTIPSAWRLRKNGFRVRICGHGSGSMRYEELEAGQIRSFELRAPIKERAQRMICFPAPDDWHGQMPGWAKDRRAEIIARVKGELGTKRFIYDGDNHPLS